MKYYLKVKLDFETSERAGFAGAFQIASLVDEADKDWINLIDRGRRYYLLQEVIEGLAGILACNQDQIHIEESAALRQLERN